MSDVGATAPFGRRFRWKSLFEIGKDLRPRFDRIILRGSLVPDQPLLDVATLPWAATLERHWTVIRDEALRIGNDRAVPSLADLSPDHGRIAADRRWKSFFLQGYGYRREENCAQAPVTARLVSEIPGLVTAMFSVLEAGCHIPRHRGVTKAMMTFHLALRVPRRGEGCRMELDGRMLHWREGRSLLFDDTHSHEVWNDTDEDRHILLLQVRRPCRGVARVLQGVFLWGVKRSRFVQDIVRRLDALQHAPAVPTR